MIATFLTAAVLFQSARPAPAEPLTAGAPAVAFVNVHVVPMSSDAVLRNHTVLVDDGRITRVAPAKDVTLPKDAQRIDGRGELYLMPGLCDSHIHVLETDEFLLYVANGVTTVRNMSGEPFHLTWRREIAEGRLLGPTLFTTGPTMDSVPPEGSNRAIVTTREEGEHAVEAIHAAGYDLIKVYGGLTADAYGGIMSAARRVNMPVVGHLARSMGLEGSLAARQASIDHAEEYLYTYFKNAGEDKIPDAVRLTREAGAWVTPTLVTFDTIGKQIGDAPALAKRTELRFVDPAVVASWLTTQNHYIRDFKREQAEDFRWRLAFQKKLVRELNRAKVPLLAGTDAGIKSGVPFVLPGFSLYEELWNLVDCGLSAYEALQTATVNPARFLGREGEFGVVAEGARADLVLVEANPLEDIAHASRRAGVMVRGRWMPKAELDSMLDALVDVYREEAEFVRILKSDGVEKAAARFVAARKKSSHARLFREGTMNSVGYEFLGAGRTADAIAVFELNADAYPKSADVYDSLGEGLMKAGEKARAIESYERSLAINPDNTNAKAMLEKLGK